MHVLSSEVRGALAQEGSSLFPHHSNGKVRWTVWKHVVVLASELCPVKWQCDIAKPLQDKVSLLHRCWRLCWESAALRVGNMSCSALYARAGVTAWPYHNEIEIYIFLVLWLQSCLCGLDFNWYNGTVLWMENPIGFRHFGGKELSFIPLCRVHHVESWHNGDI